MRHLLALLSVVSLGVTLPACHAEREGAVKVAVIGAPPRLSDPARGELSAPDAVLLENVGQGLVRFDATGNIVAGLAERWNVSDDGLSYIFRLAATNWPDGRKVTAEQVAKLLKRGISPRGRNPLRDTVGAIEDIVAMTDRVIEIRLTAPRPNLLAVLAQPYMAIVRSGQGTGPFAAPRDTSEAGSIRLTRNILASDEEAAQKEEVTLRGLPVEQALGNFAAGKVDLVLGGTFADLPIAQRAKLPRGSIQFDPASGLFGLVPMQAGGKFASPEVRRLLSQAIDRDLILAAFGVTGLGARTTVLEAGLDGVPAPLAPAWLATPLANRIPALRLDADRLFGKSPRPPIRIALPHGPGAELLLQALARSWGPLGFSVERTDNLAQADFRLTDQVAPSSSPAWFLREFRCGVVPICDPETDKLLDAARETQVPQQRNALLQQAAARIDDQQLFLPITAPIRWSLVGRRIQGFSGNRFAVHTLTDLDQRPGAAN
jgi:peptide/nickel transport system substrate-binding protein